MRVCVGSKYATIVQLMAKTWKYKNRCSPNIEMGSRVCFSADEKHRCQKLASHVKIFRELSNWISNYFRLFRPLFVSQNSISFWTMSKVFDEINFIFSIFCATIHFRIQHDSCDYTYCCYIFSTVFFLYNFVFLLDPCMFDARVLVTNKLKMFDFPTQRKNK